MHHHALSVAIAGVLAGSLLAQAPANDDCAGAIPVVNGLNGPFSSVGSTTSTPAWPCAAGGNDVWFSLTITAPSTLAVDLCGQATWDTALQIFDATGGCGGLVSLGCNDDFCALQSSLTVPVNPGPHLIRVGGFNSQTGSFSLTVTNGTVLGTNTSIGQGCIQQSASFYELFTSAPAFDLANSSMTLLFTGANYIALPGINAYVPPSATATVLTLTDDSTTSVALSSPMPYVGGATSSMSVCSNGYISVDPIGNGTSYFPSAAAMLAAPYTGWWCWHDFNPSVAGSGQVKYEEIGTMSYITWDGVFSYGTTNPETFQFQLDRSSGTVHFVWGAIGGFGNNFLVGYSPGGASTDPGSRDISATLPLTFTTDPVDVAPLSVTATSRPVLGANWNLSVGNVPATGLLGVDIFGFSDPGINDLFFLGAPGCGLRSSVDVTSGWFVTPTAGHTYSLAIPNSPSLLNFHVFTTSAVFQVPPVNAFGAITANGVDGMIGDY